MIKLGDLLIKKGLVSEEQLTKALELQKKRGGLIGAILLEMGFVEPNGLAETLEEQKKLADAGLETQSAPKKLKLGEVLVKEGIITETELNRALEKQEQTKEKLGFVLMGMGFIDQPTLLRYLSKQAQSLIDDISIATVEIDHLHHKHHNDAS
ncbi:MAG: hypothetical protein OEZ13_05010 [Spirochaetia bacterium]|nr:hypothetical protein [Spirochaetia bacterium]